MPTPEEHVRLAAECAARAKLVADAEERRELIRQQQEHLLRAVSNPWMITPN